jgi:adenylate cyclase, class 2
MAHETEIKLRVTDLKELRTRLKVLAARFVGRGGGAVHEWNVLFDTPEEDLRQRGQLLRIRTETLADGSKRGRSKNKRVLVTFKRPIDGDDSWRDEEVRQRRHKVREEIELEVSDAASLTKIFEGLGMRGWFRYEKLRTTYQFPKSQRWAKQLLIEMDETPIGTFVELEGPAKAIDRAARLLGYSEKDYIVTNYLSLYLAECRRRGEKPGDMVFRKRKSLNKESQRAK